MASQQKTNTFFGSAAVLLAGMLIVKIIGAIYKIPLGMLLTEEAYGDFNGAYNIYNFFLTISVTGLPVALSKTVSEQHTLGRENQVTRVFRVAFIAFLVMGIISFLIMSIFSGEVAKYIIKNDKASMCIQALSVAVLCTCCCSAFRGFAQGHMNMIPTSISQIIEALCKALVGLSLAYAILNMVIEPQELRERYAAVGAIAGVSVGSVFSLFYLAVRHTRARRRAREKSADVPDRSRTILSRLLTLAIPITLSSCTMSIVTLIDTNLVMGQLQDVFLGIQNGLYQNVDSISGIFDKAVAIFNDNTAAMLANPKSEIEPVLDSARSLYGTYSKAINIYNLPFNLITPLTATVVPAVSACLARKDRLGAHNIAESALRFAAMVALPAGLGLFALGTPIIHLIYFGKSDPTIGGPLLSILGLASIFVCFQLICTSILQSHGVVRLPILTVAVGGAVKILVNLALVGRPDVMVMGAPIGTLCCFIVVAVLNFILIKWKVPNPPAYFKVLFKPLLAAVVMAAAAWATQGFLSRHVSNTLTGNAVSTLGAIVVGLVVYVILVLALRILSRKDLDLMPKGDKIAKILRIR